MNDIDLKYLRRAIELSHAAHKHGNNPYGSVLVDEYDNLLLEAENTQLTDRDCTAHAETNLLREASPTIAQKTLAKSTIYASGEPCPMCAGAIYWSQVQRVVFALDVQTMARLAGATGDELLMPCREIFACGSRHIEVIGPALQAEASEALK